MRPAATVVVAISSRNGGPSAAGAAKDQGSVPSFASLPKVGATWMLEAGASHADQPFLRRHQGVIAGGSEMGGVAHRRDRHARLLGLVDRHLHCKTRRDMA